MNMSNLVKGQLKLLAARSQSPVANVGELSNAMAKLIVAYTVYRAADDQKGLGEIAIDMDEIIKEVFNS